MNLQKGENRILNHSSKISVNIRWLKGQKLTNPLAFLLDEQNKILKEEWILVKDKTNDFGWVSAIYHEKCNIEYELNLHDIPMCIKKVVFAMTTSVGEFENDEQLIRFEVNTLVGLSLNYELNDAIGAKANIICEIYRYGSQWKIKAVDQAFINGKKELLDSFGYIGTTKVVTAIDSSHYLSDFLENGKMNQLFRNIFIGTATLTKTIHMDIWFYAANHVKAQKANHENYKNYINEHFPKVKYFGGLGTENQEVPIIQEILEEYSEDEVIIYFITNGNLHNVETIAQMITGENGKNILWQFIVCGDENNINSLVAQNKNVTVHSLSEDHPVGEIQQKIIETYKKWKNSQRSFVI